MPLLVACNELTPGMRLIEPIRRGGSTLLAADKELTPTDIDLLQKRFPDTVLRISDPVLEGVVPFEDDSRDREVANNVCNQISDALNEVQARFTDRMSMRNVNFHKIQSTVQEVIAYIRENPVSAALLTKALGGDGYLAHHTGNVFYLSMLMGSAVKQFIFDERMKQMQAHSVPTKHLFDLTPLGLGAMFMDVGMIPIAEMLEGNQQLSEAQRLEIRNHPLAGHDALPPNFSPVAKMIVKTHHENMCGDGYPRGLRGSELHIFARIVRIADAFDAATSTRTYARAKSPARVLWEMTHGNYRNYYDPTLVKVFSRLVQPFPIGAKLRLTDGRYAVVVRYNRQNPFQPHVLIAFDRDGIRLPSDRLDGPFTLGQRPGIRVSSFGDDDLSFLHERPAEPSFLARPEFATAFEAAYP